MMRSGFAGMLTTPFSPSTSRGQPKLAGSTIPRTFSNALSAGSGVAVGSGAAVGATVGAAVGADVGAAVGVGVSDEQAASAAVKSTIRKTGSSRDDTVTPLGNGYSE